MSVAVLVFGYFVDTAFWTVEIYKTANRKEVNWVTMDPRFRKLLEIEIWEATGPMDLKSISQSCMMTDEPLSPQCQLLNKKGLVNNFKILKIAIIFILKRLPNVSEQIEHLFASTYRNLILAVLKLLFISVRKTVLAVVKCWQIKQIFKSIF